MTIVNLGAAKAQLSTLIDRAAGGEDIVIARNGKVVARLTMLEKGSGRLRFGALKGKVRVVGDFDAPLPAEILAEFEGG